MYTSTLLNNFNSKFYFSLFIATCFISMSLNAQLAQSKRLLGQAMTPDSNYILKYETRVSNTGNTPICDVVISDDITANYASCDVVSTDIVNVYGSGGMSVWDASDWTYLWDGGVDWDGNGAETTFSLGSNPSDLCVSAGCGTLCIAPGESVTIWFVVKINDDCFPSPGNTNTYNNQASSTGTLGNGGSNLSEISGDGSDPQSVGVDPTPAAVGYHEAILGAAQTITDLQGNLIDYPSINTDGTYDFSYHITLCNHDFIPNGGANTIEDLNFWMSVDQIPDWTNTVNSLTILNPTGPLIPNPDYDGDWGSEANLLDDYGGDLAAGQCDTIELVLNVGPIPEWGLGYFNWWAGSASGWDGSETIRDMAHDGRTDSQFNPDPTTCGPGDDCSSSRIGFMANPEINLQKEVIDILPPSSGTVGNVDVEWKFTVSNNGDVILDNISLLDSLVNNWGAACLVAVISDSTSVVNINATAASTANNAFTGVNSGAGGSADLLLGSDFDVLDTMQVFEVFFRVEIDVLNCPDPLINPATVYGTSPNGSIVSDTSIAQIDLPELGSIGDYIFNDDTNSPIEGVLVVLYDDMGNPIDSAYTDLSGNYLFDGLPPGDYSVVVDPSNFETNGPLSGYLNSTDPDDILDNTSNISLAEGEDNLDQDFGYSESGSIGDTILNDDTGDPIENVMVVLYNDLGVPLDTAYTNSLGNYLFDDLPAGDYTIDIDPSNFDPGNPLENLTNTTDPDGGFDNTSDVSILAGEDNLDQDFGYANTGGIGDTILNDDTGNPIENVMVILLDDMGNPLDTAYTNASGMYYFGDLPADTYNILIDPSNFISGGPLVGLNISTDPDGGGDHTSEVTIGVGEVNLVQDFGYQSEVLALENFNFEIIINQEDCTIGLVWNKTDINDQANYVLEFSRNGMDFQTLYHIETQLDEVIVQQEFDGYLRIAEEINGKTSVISSVVPFKPDCNLSKQHFTSFPNPSNGLISFSCNETENKATNLTIFDVRGKNVYSTRLANYQSNSFQIDLNETLDPGLYIAVLTDTKNIKHSIKIVIE